MTEDAARGATTAATSGFRNPLGCTFALVDVLGIFVVLTHVPEITTRMVGLIRLIP